MKHPQAWRVSIAALSLMCAAQARSQQPPTQYQYDAQGNLTQTQDPYGRTTQQSYDALDRLKQQVLPKPQSSATQPTIAYGYDGLTARVLSISDARQNSTGLKLDGLSDFTLISPDTWITSWMVNEVGQTDYQLNGLNVSMYVDMRDSLGRPTWVTYTDENTGKVVGRKLLTYDEFSTVSGEENYGRGHLTNVVEYEGSSTTVASSLSWRYDQWGRVSRRCQYWGGVSTGGAKACVDTDSVVYRWGGSSGSGAGRLSGLTYPSGRQVDYQYDSLGRISGVTTTAPTSTSAAAVISAVSYTPQGVGEHALAGWTFGSAQDSQSYSRTYDASARTSSFTLGKGAAGMVDAQASYTLQYDDQTGNLTIEGHTATGTPLQAQYTYDGLSRLISATLPGGSVYSYDYDLNGNRTLKSIGVTTTTYSYASGNNKLSSVQSGQAQAQTVGADIVGNITQDPAAAVGSSVTYSYTGRTDSPYGRMVKSQGPGAQWTYLHNFLEQRIRKSGATYTPSGGNALSPQAYVGSTDVLFYYDDEGHLLAEHDANSKKVLREYIWLGDIPVGVIAGSTPTQAVASDNAATLYYVHTDHLNTPRLITDAAGAQRWSWDMLTAEPFGASAPNEAPQGQAQAQQFSFNLRFPGQYFDKETATVYNHHRSYNPETGRYLQSDPIGLAGGLNTYAYVGGNPLSYTDPKGLNPVAIGALPCAANPIACAAAGAAVCWSIPACREKLIKGGKAICDAVSGPIFNDGDKDPSTPTGQRGSPIEVKPGTNQPGYIDGRDYTGHALDRMQGRGVPPSAVEEAIRNGRASPGNQPGTTVHTGSDGVTVVTGDRGQVITVIPR